MRILIICIAATAIFTASCGKKASNSADINLTDVQHEVKNAPEAKTTKDEDFSIASADTSLASPSLLQSGKQVLEDWDKKIIKTANITLELKDYNSYNNAIHNEVKRFGAYIAQEQQSQTSGQLSNDVTIKVPVEQFDDLINSFSKDSVKVLNKNITSEDVTGEVIDTKARTEAKKQVRDTYLNLLKQARNMKEILEVQDEINSIQEDIEAGTGRTQYLTHAAAYSTINLKYFQYLNGETNNYEEPGYLFKVKEAFKSGAAVISNIVLFFISIWPLTVAGIFFIFYIRRWRIKKA